ncbi:hypothetical protein SKAU_G00245850 [Synaphobranchus kaupii]|uniref:Transposable element P transposase-like GTP-binding insertion domain-containing protein n=1 Tax=Synaphobranchus kaupii TaxID=118154 RepID=A0A9Q1F1T9_SYNKA|nr:hypothetical protein SKAU_G00245850 [Synaphobranchus kaupii]
MEERGSTQTRDGKKIRWQYIEELNKLQEDEGLRLGNKIRMAHIEWRKQKMKVNLATQVFSRSVADALEIRDNTTILEATPTAANTARRFNLLPREPERTDHDYADCPNVEVISEYKEAAINYIAGFREVATELRVSQSVISSALRNRMMNVTQLQAHLREVRGTQVSQMMAANDVGDVQESAMHQPLLSPDDPLVVAVLQCGQVCLVNTELPYTLPNFIFMDDNAPAHRGRIIRERLLETGNLNDLRAALQEEWDAMPQQTISRLVNSMRRPTPETRSYRQWTQARRTIEWASSVARATWMESTSRAERASRVAEMGHGRQGASRMETEHARQMATIIRKWKKFGTTKNLPRPGRPAKLSNRERLALAREVSRNPRVTLTELQRILVEMGEPFRRSTIQAALHQSGLYAAGTGRLVLIEGKMNAAKCLEAVIAAKGFVLWMCVLSCVLTFSLHLDVVLMEFTKLDDPQRAGGSVSCDRQLDDPQAEKCGQDLSTFGSLSSGPVGWTADGSRLGRVPGSETFAEVPLSPPSQELWKWESPQSTHLLSVQQAEVPRIQQEGKQQEGKKSPQGVGSRFRVLRFNGLLNRLGCCVCSSSSRFCLHGFDGLLTRLGCCVCIAGSASRGSTVSSPGSAERTAAADSTSCGVTSSVVAGVIQDTELFPPNSSREGGLTRGAATLSVEVTKSTELSKPEGVMGGVRPIVVGRSEPNGRAYFLPQSSPAPGQDNAPYNAAGSSENFTGWCRNSAWTGIASSVIFGWIRNRTRRIVVRRLRALAMKEKRPQQRHPHTVSSTSGVSQTAVSAAIQAVTSALVNQANRTTDSDNMSLPHLHQWSRSPSQPEQREINWLSGLIGLDKWSQTEVLSAGREMALKSDALQNNFATMDPADSTAMFHALQQQGLIVQQHAQGISDLREEIKEFQVVAPLTKLTSTAMPFRWNPEAENAFKKIKKLFTSAPILVSPTDNLLHPCAFFSRKLSPAERNYDVGNHNHPAFTSLHWTFASEAGGSSIWWTGRGMALRSIPGSLPPDCPTCPSPLVDRPFHNIRDSSTHRAATGDYRWTLLRVFLHIVISLPELRVPLKGN